MLKLSSAFCAFAALVLTSALFDIPTEPMAALEHAEQYELLSIDPNPRTDPHAENLHGWRILGRTAVKDAGTRQKLTEALRAGAREHADMAAGCFHPRHGIRVTRSYNTTDFVICFECMYVQVFVANELSHGFPVARSPQPVFDDVLRKAGVALADKAH